MSGFNTAKLLIKKQRRSNRIINQNVSSNVSFRVDADELISDFNGNPISGDDDGFKPRVGRPHVWCVSVCLRQFSKFSLPYSWSNTMTTFPKRLTYSFDLFTWCRWATFFFFIRLCISFETEGLLKNHLFVDLRRENNFNKNFYVLNVFHK